MEQLFVKDTIYLAEVWLKDPALLLAEAEGCGIFNMTAETLLAQVKAVQAAATTGSEVAGWVAQRWGGATLANAASEIPVAVAAAATGAGAGAATVSGVAPVVTQAAPVAATGISLAAAAAGALALAAAAALAVGGYILIQANSEADDAELQAQRQQDLMDEQRGLVNERAVSENTPLADDGFLVVQVTNHPRTAVAVLGEARLDAHETGSSELELCHFLHGGLCGGSVVETPNGEVVGDPSPVAIISVLASSETSEGAWERLCAMVSEVRPASLAEGFLADYGGNVVTVDYGGFTNPCP